MASAKEGTDFVNKLRGLDTSGVEVDEEQEAPTMAANSAEEKAALATMEAALDGTAAATAATSEDKLMCLRGRKYDPERAAALLPKFLELTADATLRSDTLYDDVRSRKVIALGTKDVAGRGVVWLRLRFHEPKKSKAADMCRFIAIVMLRALQDVDVQRTGMCVVQDMTGLKLSNLDPTTAKEVRRQAELPSSPLPRPLRRGRPLAPPWPSAGSAVAVRRGRLADAGG
jgi:hypothetical protein